ncbi:MAG: ABC transporter permease [Armatimonadetes bacterium]|nr:ABC transporter permease [Armatimonadota bacterium]
MAFSIRVSAFSLPGSERIPAPLRRLSSILAALFLLGSLLAALFAPRLAPHDFARQSLSNRLQPPGRRHPLGTDEFGRDVASRLLFGARVSLTVALTVEAVELLFGLTLGMLAGLRGGRLDQFVMRITDLMFAFPDILLAILITGVLGKSLFNVFLALALVGWPGMVRLVRAQTLALRGKEFVEAARAAGASELRILLRHILPNLLGPVLVAATVGMGAIVLAESTLSFLGLGIQEPQPSWGSMINQAWKLRRSDPMLTVYPAALLALTIMAFNFLGDGLRDWLDPRSRSL